MSENKKRQERVNVEEERIEEAGESEVREL